MGRNNFMERISALQVEKSLLEKGVINSFKKNKSAHDMRVFFKKLKAHIVLLHALGGPQNIDFSDKLHTYYIEIGLLRDAKIFRELCKKYTHNNKLIMVLGEECVLQAKQKIKKYKKSVQTKQIAEEIEQLTTTVVDTLHGFELKRVGAGLETFFEHTENLLTQLLQSEMLTHVGFHTIRKHIKKVVYLLDYMCLFDSIKYKPIQKKYEKLAENLGDWNDLRLLVERIEEFPRTGKEENIVKKLGDKEEKMRKKLLKKLRTYFRVSPAQAIKTTQRIALEQKEVDTTKKPVTKKPVTKKPVTKKPVTKKPVTKKPVTKKPVTKKPNRPGSAQ